MSQKMGKNAAFEHFGAAGKNPVWSWSARSPDCKIVVLTLWQDEIIKRDGTLVYDMFNHKGRTIWVPKPGNIERLENLALALRQCEGFFRAVVTIAKNPGVSPRKIIPGHCYPQDHFWMRISRLDETTGEFCAESVIR